MKTRTLRQLLALILALALALSMACVPALAAETDSQSVEEAVTEAEAAPAALTEEDAQTLNGTCGETLTWEYDESFGLLIISGTGDMENYGESDQPWCDVKADIFSVVVEDGVTSIGNDAFYGCENLVIAQIPASVTSIGEHAFESCGDYLIICGYTGTLAETYAEENGLVFLSMDEEDDDSDEYQVINGTCGETLTWEYDESFGILVISGTGEMENYGESDQPWCDVKAAIFSVVVEDGVTTIGDHAFYGCESLFIAEIPSSVTSIGEHAFESCGDYLIICGYTGTIAETYAEENGLVFLAMDEEDDDSKVPSDTCGDDLTWTLEDGVLTISGTGDMYDFWDEDAPWDANADEITSVVIEDGVTSIGDWAFGWCENLESITIPDSVTSISDWAFIWYDDLTIYGYSGSAAETYASENEITFVALDGEPTDPDKPVVPDTPDEPEVPSNACGENLTWTLKDGVLTISGTGDMYDFWDEDAPWDDNVDEITSVVIKNGVASISDWAFAWCENLESAMIPDSVTSIGDWAFIWSENLTIYGYSGSAAEAYASENEITFVALDGEPVDPDEPDDTDKTNSGAITVTTNKGSSSSGKKNTSGKSESKTTEEKSESTSPVQTDDEANAVLWVALLGVSAAGVTALVRRRKV